jgi:hypothetical protein
MVFKHTPLSCFEDVVLFLDTANISLLHRLSIDAHVESSFSYLNAKYASWSVMYSV